MKTVRNSSIVPAARAQGRLAPRWAKLFRLGTALQARNPVTEQEIAGEIARYRAEKKTHNK